ncbi:hypothetical protein QR680_016320 [Steinernema hermaphroditum]|uniref:Tetraspanin n=1 Tax=Steinernema hermaphroditum TaxID=289476 RepID=A0AA39HAU1_9BILA|nr:hypothetical protein QR680_016320 [Steinernema hermaphroditum]
MGRPRSPEADLRVPGQLKQKRQHSGEVISNSNEPTSSNVFAEDEAPKKKSKLRSSPSAKVSMKERTKKMSENSLPGQSKQKRQHSREVISNSTEPTSSNVFADDEAPKKKSKLRSSPSAKVSRKELSNKMSKKKQKSAQSPDLQKAKCKRKKKEIENRPSEKSRSSTHRKTLQSKSKASSQPKSPSSPWNRFRGHSKATLTESDANLQRGRVVRRMSKRERNALRALRDHAKEESREVQDYFVDRGHKIFALVVFAALFCIARIALAASLVFFASTFYSKSLSPLYSALPNADAHPVLLTVLNVVVIGTHICAGMEIVGDIFVAFAVVTRRIRAMAYSLVVLQINGFLGMCLCVFIVSVGYHRVEISSSLIGNVGFHEHDDSKILLTVGKLQQGLRCCGFDGGSMDWIRPVFMKWTEPMNDESRQIMNSFAWQAECDNGFVCAAPKTCCVDVNVERCNEATISVKEYDEIRMQDFGLLQHRLLPKDESKIYTKGCVAAMADLLEQWTFHSKIVAACLLATWVLLTLILILTVAQLDGIRKVEVKPRKNDRANRTEWPVKAANGSLRFRKAIRRVGRYKHSSSDSSPSFRMPKFSASILDFPLSTSSNDLPPRRKK